RRYLSEFTDQIDAPRAMFQTGEIYKQLGAYDRAREAFYKTLSFAINKASTLDKSDFSSSVRLSQAATWELAETEYLANNWERADELYDRFKKQNPSLDKLIQTANFRQADVAFQLHKTQDAIAKYENALSIAPFHPFAAESWLRLVTLYGQTKQKDKQNAALQSFIWLVNTLEKDDQLYWQRRCADQLLAEYKDHLIDQEALLETILKNKDNPSWAKMLDFYLSLLDRQASDPTTNLPRPSAAANDDWNKWLGDFRTRLGGIIQQIEVMRNTDTSGSSGATSGAIGTGAATK
ncbi:MAG TPA: tetratricopeptide repeat protein, partial [Candidatus Methylacidiphilales bacterium]